MTLLEAMKNTYCYFWGHHWKYPSVLRRRCTVCHLLEVADFQNKGQYLTWRAMWCSTISNALTAINGVWPDTTSLLKRGTSTVSRLRGTRTVTRTCSAFGGNVIQRGTSYLPIVLSKKSSKSCKGFQNSSIVL